MGFFALATSRVIVGRIAAGVISGRASAHGFHFVDPRTPFSSHEICSSSEWLNGLSEPVSESYHPNVAGQQEYTNLVDPLA